MDQRWDTCTRSLEITSPYLGQRSKQGTNWTMLHIKQEPDISTLLFVLSEKCLIQVPLALALQTFCLRISSIIGTVVSLEEETGPTSVLWRQNKISNFRAAQRTSPKSKHKIRLTQFSFGQCGWPCNIVTTRFRQSTVLLLRNFWVCVVVFFLILASLVFYLIDLHI